MASALSADREVITNLVLRAVRRKHNGRIGPLRDRIEVRGIELDRWLVDLIDEDDVDVPVSRDAADHVVEFGHLPAGVDRVPLEGDAGEDIVERLPRLRLESGELDTVGLEAVRGDDAGTGLRGDNGDVRTVRNDDRVGPEAPESFSEGSGLVRD